MPFKALRFQYSMLQGTTPVVPCDKSILYSTKCIVILLSSLYIILGISLYEYQQRNSSKDREFNRMIQVMMDGTSMYYNTGMVCDLETRKCEGEELLVYHLYEL